MKGLVFYLFALIISTDTFALDCSKIITVKYLENRKNIVLKKDVCLFKNDHSFISKECLKSCQAHSNKGIQSFQIPGVGSPSHIECRQFGGRPLISEIFLDQRKYDSVICLFNDGSMITADILGKVDEI